MKGILKIGLDLGGMTQSKPTKEKEMKERPVLVTTQFRGVFFGYLAEQSDTTVKLKNARNCVYWSSDVKGFLGLAASGPSENCRVGPPADLELFGVTSISDVSPEAVEKWEAAPWG